MHLCATINCKEVIVKNFAKLAKTKERELVLQIIDAGFTAIDTEKVVKEVVSLNGDELRIGNEKFFISKLDNIYIVGVGKCSISAGGALESILGKNISDGVVIDVREGKLKYVKTISGDHPYPTEKNVGATQEIIKLLKNATEKDLVIFIISGGGSTLLCNPTDMTCLDEAEILKCLYSSSVGIRKINTVRKHLSKARGGHLAEYAYPAKAVSLIFSDVPGDDLEFIASGPTVKDTTTVEDAEKIIKECELTGDKQIKNINLVETPKDDKYFENVKNILVVSNKVALAAMAERAKSEGYTAEIVASAFEGEARDVAKSVVDKLHLAKSKSVYLYGGESTVTIRHAGKGGRNLEFALSALVSIERDELVAAVASDGHDNTDFAGAISDSTTLESSKKLGLTPEECLDANCSYAFFERTEDYIKTGDTGRNVADFVIAVKS